FESGLVMLNGPSRELAHLADVSRERALGLWLLLAAGRVDELAALPWRPGQPPRDPEAEKRHAADVASWQREYDPPFYELLEAEASSEPCAVAGCDRGRTPRSVHCRAHHFEAVRKRPCPF